MRDASALISWACCVSVGLDPILLLSFYQSKLTSSLSTSTAQAAAGVSPTASTATKASSATANDAPPWEAPSPDQTAMDAKVLATTNFLDTSNVPLSATTKPDQKTEQDNQKLFSLYTAINTL